MNDGDAECKECGALFWAASEGKSELCRRCLGAPNDETLALFLRLVLANHCIAQIEPVGSADVSIVVSSRGFYFATKGAPKNAIQRCSFALEKYLSDPPSMRLASKPEPTED